jgi:hypothetical protein
VTGALFIATSVPVPIATADVGLGQCRRIVDAVARHRHHPALALKLAAPAPACRRA